MKNLICRLFPLLFIALITSCGGGGGGSSGSANTPTTGNNSSKDQLMSSSVPASSVAASSVIPLSSSASSSSVGITDSLPKVSFVFPQQNAVVTSNKITVRGHASDADGIKNIKVNGVLASFNNSGSSSSGTTTVLNSIAQKLNLTGLFSKSNNKSAVVTDADWQATVDVPFGNTNIDVVVEDEIGNSKDDSTSSINLKNLRVPTTLLKDTKNKRWIGVGSVFEDSIAVDMSTKQLTLLPALSVAMHDRTLESHGPESLQIDGSGNNLFASSTNLGVLTIYKTNVDTAELSKLIDYDIKFDGTKNLFANVMASAMDLQNGIYYILVNSYSSNAMTRSQIFAYDINSNHISSIYDTDTDKTLLNGGIRDIVYSSGALYLLNNLICCDFGVYKFDLSTNVMSRISSSLGSDKLRMATDNNSNYLYIVGLLSTVKINLKNLSLNTISEENTQVDFHFPQPVRAIVDDENNNLIVADSMMSDLFTIKIDTGERALFIQSGIGSGSKMQSPISIAVTSDKKTVYVLDDGINAIPSIFKIDLVTGNRKRLVGLDPSTSPGLFKSIILDELHNRLFAAIGKNIVKVDINNEQFSILNEPKTKDNVLLGSIGAMTFDGTTNKLIIASFDTQIIFGFDLETNELSIVKDLTNTEGPDVAGLGSIIKFTDKNSLLALNQKQGKLYSIDLLSGKKTLLLDTCLDMFARNVMSPDYDTLSNMEYDQKNKLLYLYGIYFDIFDLSSNSCKVNYGLYNPRDGRMLNDSTLLISTEHEIDQLDLKTNERAVLSR